MFFRDFAIIVSGFNIFLALLMLYNNWKHKRNILFLTLFLVFFSLHIISGILLFFGGSVKLLALLLNNFAPFFYLYPVMLYFYVRSIVNDNFHVKKIDILHFVPFLINLIAVLPYWFSSWEFKFDVAQRLMGNIPDYLTYDFKLFYPPWLNNMIRPIQFVFYLILSAILIQKFSSKVKKFATTSKINQNQISVLLYFILMFFFVFNIIFAALSYQLVISNNNVSLITYLFEILKITSYLTPLIPVSLLLMPKLIYGFPVSNYSDSTVISTDRNSTLNRNVKEENYSGLKKTETDIAIASEITDPFQVMSVTILTYFENERPYLKQGFSVHDVCQHISAPRHHVQYCFNVIMNKKFADLKNEYRVRYAMELLKSESATSISIEGIGRQSGFSTNANFYISFRNITGMTPNHWLQNYRNVPKSNANF